VSEREIRRESVGKLEKKRDELVKMKRERGR
jgi:hypothetical protein